MLSSLLKSLCALFILITPSFTYAIELLELKIVSYDDFERSAPEAIQLIQRALLEDGIVGIRGIPGYRECTEHYIQAAREFAALPGEIKQQYAPDRASGKWLGYEIGKEKFVREDGAEVIDNAKSSYYAYVEYGNLDPEQLVNVWPSECNLEVPFLAIGQMMFQTAKELLQKIHYIQDDCGVVLDLTNGVGRMLDYKPDPLNNNPFWCGAHFDHSLFTALLPAFYFKEGVQIPEPLEAGLFVLKPSDNRYYKVVSDDPNVMLFQTGEFAELATNGLMRATKHRVVKAFDDNIERITMALFIGPENEALIHSTDPLAQDYRYTHRINDEGKVEERTDGLCRFLDWHILSLQRYEAK